MPVQIVRDLSIGVLVGGAPSAPTSVTSITKDSGAWVSFLAPADQGLSSITHYIVTPYVGATPQSPTTVAVGSLETINGAYNGDSKVYRRANVTGLTNSTAYTFTVKARNSNGDSVESAASGANTPLANLVFGDDFNGPANSAPDPEWWVYDRCGFIAQQETQWYKPSHCVLDGSGNLKLTVTPDAVGGYSYPSDGNAQYPNGQWRDQTCTSGACQSNTKTWYPAVGHSMTYETRQQVSAGAGGTLWPGFFWLNGQYALESWKTDPGPNQWNDTDHAEIDVAEWYRTGGPNTYKNVTWAGSNLESPSLTTTGTSMHVYDVVWTPGTNVVFHRDGAETWRSTSQVPSTGAQFVLLIYLQIWNGTPSSPESIYTDYVRVYQN